jgi:glutamate-1-semialdehyde aminotransferase
MPAHAVDGIVTEQPPHDRAAAVIAGGASTGSKRAEALYGPGAPPGPTHFRSARGCTVIGADGRSYVDCTMGLGSVALGYADEGVNRRVIDAIRDGTVAGWSPLLEIEVAERLRDVIPCAERVRFLKTGAEAVAAAVRIARAATGRTKVVGCGYFGWLDWSNESAGIPAGVRGDFARVPFGDVRALEHAVADAGSELAAVVIEPVIERLPPVEWVRSARSLTDRAGAALVFDEIKTGFRLRPGGYQESSGIVPDLATFGKAIANGFPLAVVAGRADVMAAATTTWISSTLASETSALAAASAVLDRHAREDVCGALARAGREMRARVAGALSTSGVQGVTIDGIDPMWMLRFDDEGAQSRFIAGALEEGVLFKRGAYCFPALAHDERAMDAIGDAARRGFDRLKADRR